MSLVEKKSGCGINECNMSTDARNAPRDNPHIEEDADKKASRVSKLREMFQTGVVRPIEDFEECTEVLTKEELRLLRTCPGSPPLLSLRAHHSGVPSANATNKRTPSTIPNSTVPPTRPPKPKDLLLRSGLTPRHLLPSVRSRVSPRLWKFVAVFESGASQDGQLVKPKSSISTKSESVVVDKVLLSTSDSSTSKSNVTISSSTRRPSAVTIVSEFVSQSAETPQSSVKKGQLSSQKNEDNAHLLVSDAVSSCQPLSGSTVTPATGDGDLQHAEPIAVATPDEDDDETAENEMERLGLTTVQQLKTPSGLKVVAVDSLGVHILEDGNFFYATPGVFDRPDSPVEPGLSTPHFQQSEANNHDRSFSERIPEASRQDLSTSNHSDGSNKHVRFSAEPILIFSTHSTSEYDRKNDEIDPLAASAAYELEKRLETMELIEVDLKKTDQGLGLSIVGVGLDLDGGEKLGIFIKSLAPGGAAELSGTVKADDQIVEVDGINLVGVSYAFAAQTLRSTGETVHFVLGRTTDPNNHWMMPEQDDGGSDEFANKATVNSLSLKQSHLTVSNSPPQADFLETHKMSVNTDEAPQLDENEDTTEVDSVDLSLTSNPLFGNDLNEPDISAISMANNRPSLNGRNSEWNRRDSPRSALKGTATAASTKRRHDAIAHLIKLAIHKSRDVSASEILFPTDTDSSDANCVQWTLAGDLYDCQRQLVKLHSQIRILEQKLTAQEAAADEAIERLCMQCRHLELELYDTHDRLRQSVHCSSLQSDNSDPGLSFCFPIPRSHSQLHGTLLSNVDTKLPPLGFVSPVDLKKHEDRCERVSTSAKPDNASSLSPLDASSVSLVHAHKDPISDSSSSASSNSRSDYCVNLRDAFKQRRNRARLFSSGGMARRRPPSRIEINPPPFTLVGSIALSDQTTMLTDVSTSTPTVCDDSSTQLRVSTAPSIADDSAVQPPLTLQPLPFPAVVNPSLRRPLSAIGVQLHGLTEDAVSSALLRRRRDGADGPPPTVVKSSSVVTGQSRDVGLPS